MAKICRSLVGFLVCGILPLLASVDSGGYVGVGPCSLAYSLYNPYTQQWGHSFGQDQLNYTMQSEGEREYSHWFFSSGYLSFAQHPACGGSGDDGGPGGVDPD
jgi:hypothetical protein